MEGKYIDFINQQLIDRNGFNADPDTLGGQWLEETPTNLD